MKLKSTRQKFLDAVTAVSGAVGGSLQITNNILIDAKADGKVTLVGTNLDMEMSTTFECNVEEAGSITAPASYLSSMLSAITASEVEFSHTGDDKARLTGGSTAYRVSTMPTEDFPKSAKLTGTEFKVNSYSLETAIKLTAYAASTDKTRMRMMGVHMSTRTGDLVFEATDGRRACVFSIPGVGADNVDVILPRPTVALIRKLLTKCECDVSVVVGKEGISFSTESWSLYSRIVDDLYPNIKQVIPENYTQRIVLDNVMFAAAVKQASVGCDSSSLRVKVLFSKSGGVVKASEFAATAKATFDIERAEIDEDVEMSFFPVFLHELITSLDDTKVDFYIDGANKPMVAKSEDGTFISVVMPMRIN